MLLINLFRAIGKLPKLFFIPIGVIQRNVGETPYSAFNRVLDIYNSKDYKYIELTESYKELIHSLMAFIDDGYHIIKCLYSVNECNKKIMFVDKWLENVDPKPIKQYKDNIKDYRDLLANVVNKIKHNHAIFSSVNVITNIGTVLGYCIMGVDNNECILPYEDIHKPIGKMSTGFSYNYDIRYNLVSFYYVARKIMEVMQNIIYTKHTRRITINKIECTSEDQIWNIVNKANDLRHLYFPDEYSKDMPQIELNKDVKSIKLRYPATKTYANKLFKYSNYRVEFITSGDGSTKSFKVPYMGSQI